MRNRFPKTTTRLFALIAGAGLALASCGSDTQEIELTKATAGFAKQLAQKTTSKLGVGKSSAAKPAAAAAPADPNAVIAAALKATDGPIALVVRLDTQAVLAMTPVGKNGKFVTWKGATGQSITFQNGVLSNTRGLGDDLMASKIDAAVSAITSRREATYVREHYYLGDLGQSARLLADCSLKRSGSEKVAIGAINANATIMKESCSKNGISFNNIYWVDGSGNVLKSSQWVSQIVGAVAVQNLRL